MFLKNFSLICLALNRAPHGFGPNLFPHLCGLVAAGWTVRVEAVLRRRSPSRGNSFSALSEDYFAFRGADRSPRA